MAGKAKVTAEAESFVCWVEYRGEVKGGVMTLPFGRVALECLPSGEHLCSLGNKVTVEDACPDIPDGVICVRGLGYHVSQGQADSTKAGPIRIAVKSWYDTNAEPPV